jgi:hypothetical protein
MKKLLLTIVLLLSPCVALAAPGAFTQAHFLFRNDDGTEVTATSIAGTDVSVTNISKLTSVRYR